MDDTWDVIIVGARCAGATLAHRLARAGARTLVLEADARGSDMPMSTHFMQPPGMAALDRTGVGELVRRVTPATNTLRIALDDAELRAPLGDKGRGYCVRRSTLDPLLQEAAEQAGAELRFGHKVVALSRARERVNGVVVQSASGPRTLRADMVIGADGAHSTIAKLTGAPEYLTEHSTRGGYWGYFPAPSRWQESWDATLEHRGDTLRYVFRCDGDLLILVAASSVSEVASWGKAYREKLTQVLDDSPTTRVLRAGREPVGRVMGLLRMRYFYRKPIGPGFALVGDAGHFKDVVTGQGMTDALLDAERLASALLVPNREQALEHFWHARDVATLPLHFDALNQGRLGYNSPFNRYVIGQIGAAEELRNQIALVAARELAPGELVQTSRMLRWMAAALLRGRFDVLRGFLPAGKRLSEERRILDSHKALLRAAEAALADAPPRRPEPLPVVAEDAA